MRRWIWVLCVVACGSSAKSPPDGSPDAPICHVEPVTSDVVPCDGIGYGLPAVAVGTPHVMSQLADVSGDGKLDVIAPVLGQGGGVAVALGTGTGTFAAATTYAAGAETVGVAVGDLNGDGAADLAAVSQAQAEDVVFVLLNQGNGTFGAATSIAVGAGPRAVVIGDLEPDGDRDIVVTSFTSNSVTILRNTGAGAFATPTTLGASMPMRLALGRLDTDTHPDLVVVGFGTMTVFENAGDGTFPAGAATATGQVNDVAIADFNGDGEGDVALAKPDGISVYAGSGNGALGAPLNFNFRVANGVVAGDVDGNGRPDVVATGWDGVTLLLRGETEFTQTTQPFQAPPLNNAVTTGDIDGDGDLDLAIASLHLYGIALLRNPGNGSFLSSTLLDSTATGAVGVGDLDGDLRDDVIFADGNRHLRVYVNDTLTADHALGRPGYAIAVADVTQDGKPDVIVSTDRDVQVFAGQGGGALAPAGTYPTGVESFEISVVDLDGDGARDIVVPHPAPPMPGENGQTIGILLNQGDGTFAAQRTYPIGGTMSGAAIADFTGDCKPDLVVAAHAPYELELLPGMGDGTFGEKQVLPTEFPMAVATTDIDGDDRSDLITLTGQAIVVMRGRGDGTFEQASTTPTIAHGGSQPLKLVDFDGDARHDVIVTNDLVLAVHHGNADGTFAPPRVYNMLGQPWIVGDLDGDHRVDVLARAGGGTPDDWRLYKVLGSCAP